MTPKLAAYLRRIGYAGSLECTLQTLRHLHRAHLLAVTYENIDVLCGVPLSLDAGAAFEKIVQQGRGGWCYEMNGLFAWALAELGYDFSLVGAAAARKKRGDAAAMNHLAILVHLERPYLADVGFGNGFLTPLPLEEGTHSDGRFDFRLERIEDAWWRLHNGTEPGDTFDFQERPYAIEAFEEQNRRLQSAPESPFVRNIVCHRFTQDGVFTLRGAVLTTITPEETRQEIAQSRDDLAKMLRSRFFIETPHVDAIWERAGKEALA